MISFNLSHTKSVFSRGVGLGLAFVLTAQSALGSVAESNFWAERRNALTESRSQAGSLNTGSAGGPLQLAALPASARSPQAILNHLPSVGAALSNLPVIPKWSETNTQSAKALPAGLKSVLDAIPLIYGSIQEVHDAGNDKVSPVVLLQDVHLNHEAQSNIASILQELIDQNHAQVVGVEGAFGEFDFRPFRAYGQSEETEAVAGDLLRQNLLAAPSYVGLTSLIDPPVFIGVDNLERYEANLDALYDARRIKPAALTRLKNIQAASRRAKDTHFSQELREFDDLRASYHASGVGLGRYAQRLAEGRDDIDFVLERFLSAYSMETEMDFPRVESERRIVIQALAARLNEKEASALMAQSIAYRMGRMTFGDYHRALRALCEAKGVRLAQTPHFENYIRYVLLSDGIAAEPLFAAVHQLEERVVSELARTPEEKALARISERVSLIEKLMEFSLTPHEWERYEAGRMSLENLSAALADLSGGAIKTSGVELTSFEAFYREADLRSHAMVRSLAGHKASGPGARVLVLGGFHTPQVAREVRAAGLSYVVVSPKITRIDGSQGSAYLSVFARDKTPLDRLFAGEPLFVYPAHANVGAPHKSTALMNLLLPAALSVLPVAGAASTSQPSASVVHGQSIYTARYAPGEASANKTLQAGPVIITQTSKRGSFSVPRLYMPVGAMLMAFGGALGMPVLALAGLAAILALSMLPTLQWRSARAGLQRAVHRIDGALENFLEREFGSQAVESYQQMKFGFWMILFQAPIIAATFWISGPERGLVALGLNILVGLILAFRPSPAAGPWDKVRTTFTEPVQVKDTRVFINRLLSNVSSKGAAWLSGDRASVVVSQSLRVFALPVLPLYWILPYTGLITGVLIVSLPFTLLYGLHLAEWNRAGRPTASMWASLAVRYASASLFVFLSFQAPVWMGMALEGSHNPFQFEMYRLGVSLYLGAMGYAVWNALVPRTYRLGRQAEPRRTASLDEKLRLRHVVVMVLRNGLLKPFLYPARPRHRFVSRSRWNDLVSSIGNIGESGFDERQAAALTRGERRQLRRLAGVFGTWRRLPKLLALMAEKEAEFNNQPGATPQSVAEKMDPYFSAFAYLLFTKGASGPAVDNLIRDVLPMMARRSAVGNVSHAASLMLAIGARGASSLPLLIAELRRAVVNNPRFTEALLGSLGFAVATALSERAQSSSLPAALESTGVTLSEITRLLSSLEESGAPGVGATAARRWFYAGFMRVLDADALPLTPSDVESLPIKKSLHTVWDLMHGAVVNKDESVKLFDMKHLLTTVFTETFGLWGGTEFAKFILAHAANLDPTGLSWLTILTVSSVFSIIHPDLWSRSYYENGKFTFSAVINKLGQRFIGGVGLTIPIMFMPLHQGLIASGLIHFLPNGIFLLRTKILRTHLGRHIFVQKVLTRLLPLSIKKSPEIQLHGPDGPIIWSAFGWTVYPEVERVFKVRSDIPGMTEDEIFSEFEEESKKWFDNKNKLFGYSWYRYKNFIENPMWFVKRMLIWDMFSKNERDFVFEIFQPAFDYLRPDDPQKTLEIFWLFLVQTILSENYRDNLGQDNRSYKEEFRRYYSFYFSKAQSLGFQGSFQHLNFEGILEDRLLSLAAAQPSLGAIIGRILSTRKQLPLPSIPSTPPGEDAKNLEPKDARQHLPNYEDFVEYLSSILEPNTPTQFSPWRRAAEFVLGKALAVKTVVMQPALPYFSYGDAIGFSRYGEFQLNWIDRMMASGYKEWAFTGVNNFILPLIRYHEDQPFQQIIQTLENYLNKDKPVNIRDYLGIKSSDQEPILLTNTLLMLQRLADLRRNQKAHVRLYPKYEIDSQKKKEAEAEFNDWLNANKDTKKVIYGSSIGFVGMDVRIQNALYISHLPYFDGLEDPSVNPLIGGRLISRAFNKVAKKIKWGEKKTSAVVMTDEIKEEFNKSVAWLSFIPFQDDDIIMVSGEESDDGEHEGSETNTPTRKLAKPILSDQPTRLVIAGDPQTPRVFLPEGVRHGQVLEIFAKAPPPVDDGERSVGGIMYWLKNIVLRFFPGISSRNYDLRVGPVLENVLALLAGGLLVGISVYLVTGELHLAVRSANTGAWALFFGGHLIDLVTGKGQRAPPANLYFAGFIAFVNTSIGFLSLPALSLILAILIGSTLVHLSVNHVAPKLAAPTVSPANVALETINWINVNGGYTEKSQEYLREALAPENSSSFATAVSDQPAKTRRKIVDAIVDTSPHAALWTQALRSLEPARQKILLRDLAFKLVLRGLPLDLDQLTETTESVNIAVENFLDDISDALNGKLNELRQKSPWRSFSIRAWIKNSPQGPYEIPYRVMFSSHLREHRALRQHRDGFPWDTLAQTPVSAERVIRDIKVQGHALSPLVSMMRSAFFRNEPRGFYRSDGQLRKDLKALLAERNALPLVNGKRILRVGVIGAAAGQQPISVAVEIERTLQEMKISPAEVDYEIHVFDVPTPIYSLLQTNNLVYPKDLDTISHMVENHSDPDHVMRATEEIKRRYFQPRGTGLVRADGFNTKFHFHVVDLLSAPQNTGPQLDMVLLHNVLQYLRPSILAFSEQPEFTARVKDAAAFVASLVKPTGVLSLFSSGTLEPAVLAAFEPLTHRQGVKPPLSPADVRPTTGGKDFRVASDAQALYPQLGHRLASPSPSAQRVDGAWYNHRIELSLPKEEFRANHRAIARRLDTLMHALTRANVKADRDNLADIDIDAYVDALRHAERLFRAHRLNAARFESVLLRFHSEMMPPTWGGYGDPVAAPSVQEVIASIFSEAAQPRMESDPVRYAAEAFVKIVKAQAFHNGNHRVADFVMNFILVKNGLNYFVLTPSNVVRYYKMLALDSLLEGRHTMDEITEFFRSEVAASHINGVGKGDALSQRGGWFGRVASFVNARTRQGGEGAALEMERVDQMVEFIQAVANGRLADALDAFAQEDMVLVSDLGGSTTVRPALAGRDLSSLLKDARFSTQLISRLAEAKESIPWDEAVTARLETVLLAIGFHGGEARRILSEISPNAERVFVFVDARPASQVVAGFIKAGVVDLKPITVLASPDLVPYYKDLLAKMRLAGFMGPVNIQALTPETVVEGELDPLHLESEFNLPLDNILLILSGTIRLKQGTRSHKLDKLLNNTLRLEDLAPIESQNLHDLLNRIRAALISA